MENFERIHLPWPDWKIVKYLGGGAYGKVYEIERNTSGIQEKAALKIISRPKDESELEEDSQNGYDHESIMAKYTEILQDYINEYKLMKELQGQSNIVSCDDFALEKNPNGIGGKIYIRMELLTPLQKVTKERLLSEKEVIKLGKDICKALILCENKNIIHRDIKPDNVMISPFGDYKLGDFGVSKVMSHTTGGTMTGTEGYIAPEVLHMEKYGKEVDIYSLGIVMYWLLNNRRMPFIEATGKLTPSKANEASMRRYQGEKIPAPQNGSARLKQIVLKACEYRPKDRYTSAQDMYDALNSLENEKVSTQSTVHGNQARSFSDDGWMENGDTLGKTMGGFNGGQTAGNSWSSTSETIGAPKGKKKKDDFQEDTEAETIGIKKAYQEQEKKAEEKKEVTTGKSKKKFKAKWIAVIIVLLICSVPVTYGLIKIKESSEIDFSESKHDLDENGNMIRSTYYYKNGNPGIVDEYGDGYRKSETRYWADGTIMEEIEWNENGDMLKHARYDKNGELESRWILEYDENNNNIKTTEYDKNDEIKSIKTHEYDENGNEIKLTMYDGENNVKSVKTSEYDSNNNITKETFYDSEGNIVSYYVFEEPGDMSAYTEYDAKGNVISHRK